MAMDVSIHAPVKGRPYGNGLFPFAGAVSIHAPVKGRPCSALTIAHKIAVSIHAPVKGRPSRPSPTTLPNMGFNPRPREGATLIAGGQSNGNGRFNPRPREGATLR